MRPFIDLTGRTFGRLLVLERVGDRGSRWICGCICGGRVEVSGASLRAGKSSSCGCFHRERASRANQTHGRSRSAEFKAWSNMRQRCQNPKNDFFADYGGRGITVCERWETFENFFEDMGPRPSPKHSIDRKENAGNYEPGNVRWAVPSQQMSNRRNAMMVTAFGITQCVAHWEQQAGVPANYFRTRLKRGIAPQVVLQEWSPWGEAFPVAA